MVKNLPTMQETQDMWIQSLGQEDYFEEEMAIHSSILAWEIPRTEEPCGLQSIGLQSVKHDDVCTYVCRIPLYICTISSLSIHPIC